MKVLCNSADCIKGIRDALEKSNGAPIEFELQAAVNIETGETYAALPPLWYRYKAGKKWKRSHVNFNFCPFCGKEAA